MKFIKMQASEIWKCEWTEEKDLQDTDGSLYGVG